ncbi:sulfite exporter TauE/SafE family protein [candidate division KSB1 bacterium]
MNDVIIPLLIFVAGVVSSFINIMAGGGSVLTLGAMMLLGLDAPVANGTNRIGILFGGTSGVLAYKSENYSYFKESLILTSFTIPGAIIGAVCAINVSNLLFQRILAIVMIFIIVTLLLPKKKTQETGHTNKISRILIYPAMFCVGLYGGFIQAGVGFLIMASLRHLLNMELLKINVHKNLIVLIYTIPVLFIFGSTNNIHWLYAFLLAMGNIVGAWASVKISVKKGNKAIKAVLIIAMLLMLTKFLLTF